MNIAEFITKIKRRETPFYDRLYRIAKVLRKFEIPYVPGFHDFLYHERNFRINAWRTFWRIIYCQPLFRSRCVSCGRNLHIYHSGQGLPLIQGDLQIVIGDNVHVYDRITLAALTVGNKPKLIVGDNTDISTRITILVGSEVAIGSSCMIGCTLITDNPGHNFEYKERLDKLKKEKIGKVFIGNRVWAALDSMIIGNVRIGDGAVIGARAVVTKDVPPFCVVTGNPTSIVKKLPFPEEMIARLGREEYQKYLDAKVNSGH
jgi:acetyltransferase-like isoleucine patch superfamily enzyme